MCRLRNTFRHASNRSLVYDVINRLGKYGTLILQEGYNLAPGTPVESINAMYAAAEGR